MATQPLVHVGDRLGELGRELAELARQRALLDGRIEALLAEVRALGIPGAVVPSPNGTADAGGPRLPALPETTGHVTGTFVKTSPWPEPARPRVDAPHEATSVINRVLYVLGLAGEPMTMPQMSVEIDEPLPRIRRAIRRLFGDYGRIDHVDRGFYRINVHGRKHLARLKAMEVAVAPRLT
jgi:hypothetical protein